MCRPVTYAASRVRAAILVNGALLSTFGLATAGPFKGDGNSFAECMEARRETSKAPAQVSIAAAYCRSKHASEANLTQSGADLELGEFYSVRIDGGGDTLPGAVNAVANMKIRSVRRKLDAELAGYDLEIVAHNENGFSIDGLVVGLLPTTKKVQACPANGKFSTTVTCDGVAGANLTGTFSCNSLIERANFKICKLGFIKYMRPSETEVFKAQLAR